MFTTIPITVLSFAGALVVIILIPSYYRVRNTPVLLSIFWLCSTSLFIAINTAGWQHNVSDKWQVYCEISVRIVYASPFALQCCSVLLLSRLEAIAATRYVSLTDSAKKRRMVIELVVGFILPILYIALAVINQGHRYDIIEGLGPTISIFPSVLSLIFSTAPTLVASVIATVYALLCAYWLFLRRRQLSAVLSSSGSGINISQYVRLFGLSCMELLWTVPINWSVQMQNLLNRGDNGQVLYPYKSWAYVHQGYWSISQVTIEDLRQTSVGRKNIPIMYLGALSISVSCFIFFIFLGTSTEISRDLTARLGAFCPVSKWASKISGRQGLFNVHSVRRQPALSESRSQPPLTPNEELKMKDFDESRADEMQIEVLVERTRYEDSLESSRAM
uniref:Pheromone receptor 3 n=1 Tax=Ustilago esculenta TaxID=185366 RepID=A0A0U2ZSL6_9BASI|nr:pheromone receptor 3 [Ustilago esculenta]QBH70102.1 pheromone receptor a3 [Ustilago esculenta]